MKSTTLHLHVNENSMSSHYHLFDLYVKLDVDTDIRDGLSSDFAADLHFMVRSIIHNIIDSEISQ